jgi:CRP-like cAMP-binding protein
LSAADPESGQGGFQGLEVEPLLRAGKTLTLPAHAVLCQQGQTTDRFFVITAGEVELAKSIAGKAHALSTSGPGSVLAFMAALDGEPSTVSMRTLGDATVVEITRGTLLALLDSEVAANSNLVHDLALVAIRRLRAATDELAQTLFQALRSSPRAGRIVVANLARIQASNHAWPCAKLAA